jgi:prenyltransferase beta subunit
MSTLHHLAGARAARARYVHTRRVAITACLLALVCLSACSPALGADAQDKGYLESTVRFLQEAQNPDGGFGATPGGPSDPDISAWAAIGLAAAGINPQQQARPGGHSVYAYLTEHAGELKETTNFERALLVADAAGTSPHDFGGVDLVARILERQLPDHAFAHEAGEQTVHGVNDTVFAILSLSPVHEPAVQAAVQVATEWLIEAQSTKNGESEGSWNSTCLESLASCDGPEGEGPPGEVDMTGAAVEALNAAGVHGSEAQQRALEFLQRAQSPGEGGFPEFLPREPGEAPANAASASWAVQALWSAGVTPETWHAPDGPDPLEFLARLQKANGSISYLPGESEGSVWMTAYTAAAFAGQALPIVDVPPPEPPAPAPPPSPAPSPLQIAPARVSRPVAKPNHGKGVIVGGGGRGARLFSRPRPGGQGPFRESQSVNPTSESAATARQRAATARYAPAHHSSRPPSQARGAQEVSAPPSGSQVTGLLLDEPVASRTPGLRSAATAPAGSWTTTAILMGLALLVIAGVRLERRWPRARDRAQVGT